MNTTLTLGHLSDGTPLTMDLQHFFPLTQEYLDSNGVTITPTPENGFATGPCDCDVDYRCSNHDTLAEMHWNYDQLRGTSSMDAEAVFDAYEAGDPKRYDALEALGVVA